MIEDGLVNEVQRLLDRGYSRELTSLQGLGYKEIISFLNNDISLSEAVDLIKQRSRHFAKRQLTWYRSFPDAEWIDLEGD
jgi:tRNA dimethylallyltransferase